jgi:colanic acid biosynthesis glycosyl transferase WcaI
MSRYAMPSKTWAMMSVSLPMICTAEKNSELYEIISQTEAGVLIKPGDYIELENQIRILYSEKDKIGIYGKNGRCYAEKNLSREEATKKYFNLLFEMAEKASFKDGAY